MRAAAKLLFSANRLNPNVVNVGQGGPGAGFFGYNTDPLVGSSFGSLTVTAGQLPPVGNLIRLLSVPGSIDLELDMQSGGTVPQNSFLCLYVQDLSGVVRQFLSSAATFSGGLWTWGTGSNPVWNASVVGANRNVYFANR